MEYSALIRIFGLNKDRHFQLQRRASIIRQGKRRPYSNWRCLCLRKTARYPTILSRSFQANQIKTISFRFLWRYRSKFQQLRLAQPNTQTKARSTWGKGRWAKMEIMSYRLSELFQLAWQTHGRSSIVLNLIFILL